MVRGIVEAATHADAVRDIRRQGLAILEVELGDAKADVGEIIDTGNRRRRLARAFKTDDTVAFCSQVAVMLRTGVPLKETLETFAEQAARPEVAELVRLIRDDVCEGEDFSSALARWPRIFPPLMISLMRAAEASGMLDEMMTRVAKDLAKQRKTSRQVKGAMAYPAVMLGVAVVAVAIIVVTVIMLFVIPAFKGVFESFGADLPTPTLIVIAMSDFVVANWYILFGVLGGSIYALLQAWKRSPAVQAFMDRALLKLPIFGEVIRKATIARWLRTLSTMFAAGVPLVEALDSVGGASGNIVYLQATKKIQAEVSTGTSLTTSMQGVKVFPNMVLQMSAIGEESGSLDAMLAKAADIFEREVDDAVDSLASLLEPLIMVFLGTIIGGLVVAMYLPIFKLGQVV